MRTDRIRIGQSTLTVTHAQTVVDGKRTDTPVNQQTPDVTWDRFNRQLRTDMGGGQSFLAWWRDKGFLKETATVADCWCRGAQVCVMCRIKAGPEES